MAITAKVRCNLKQEYGQGSDTYATVGFMPDYADAANQEWSAATPHIDVRMTLRGDAAQRFEPGNAYTLTFTQD